MRAGRDACPCRGCSLFRVAYSMRYARADTAVRPYAEFINGNPHGTFGKRVSEKFRKHGRAQRPSPTQKICVIEPQLCTRGRTQRSAPTRNSSTESGTIYIGNRISEKFRWHGRAQRPSPTQKICGIEYTTFWRAQTPLSTASYGSLLKS